jgi:hypothetical protein
MLSEQVSTITWKQNHHRSLVESVENASKKLSRILLNTSVHGEFQSFVRRLLKPIKFMKPRSWVGIQSMASVVIFLFKL